LDANIEHGQKPIASSPAGWLDPADSSGGVGISEADLEHGWAEALARRRVRRCEGLFGPDAAQL
jgi:hypothetical protein